MECAKCGKPIDKNDVHFQQVEGHNRFSFYDFDCAMEVPSVMAVLQGIRAASVSQNAPPVKESR